MKPGNEIPAPTGDPVVTLSGEVTPNVGDSLEFDRETIESIGLIEYTVDDPWENASVTYTGVLLSDLLEVAGAPSSASAIHLVALDDYAADISLADVERLPIMLATRSDGEYMEVVDGGPTRIVYPYHAYPDLEDAATNDLWVWSIARIEVP
ncbi:MAG: molybdopterin-dependent oxidoreductase [Dehalococcoidia bacterium]